jgi:hypothetical protein
MQGAILGLPIQLISRMAGVATGALGGTAGKIFKYTAYGGMLLGAVAPYIGKDLEATGGEQSQLGDLLTSLVSFMDLNASELEIIERKRLAIHDIPGRTSDWIQDMGRKSTVYRLKGKFFAMDTLVPGLQTSALSVVFKALYGDTAVGNSYLLRQIEQFGVPVPFINKMEIAEVIISGVNIKLFGGKPNYVTYDMTLIEYRKLPTIGKLGGLAAASILGRL